MVAGQGPGPSAGTVRMTARRFGCALLLWPVAELVLLLVAASAWGWWTVLVILVIGAIVGGIVVRLAAQATGRSWAQALRTMQQRRVVADPVTGEILAIDSVEGSVGEMPMAPAAQTVLLIPAGLLIAVPGFIGDAVGLVLLIPGVRRAIASRWERRLRPGEKSRRASVRVSGALARGAAQQSEALVEQLLEIVEGAPLHEHVPVGTDMAGGRRCRTLVLPAQRLASAAALPQHGDLLRLHREGDPGDVSARALVDGQDSLREIHVGVGLVAGGPQSGTPQCAFGHERLSFPAVRVTADVTPTILDGFPSAQRT